MIGEIRVSDIKRMLSKPLLYNTIKLNRGISLRKNVSVP